MTMKAGHYWLILAVFSISCQDSPTSPTVLAPEENKLARFDSLMISFMSDNGIDAGALSIMKNSRVVYEKTFGWKDSQHTQI